METVLGALLVGLVVAGLAAAVTVLIVRRRRPRTAVEVGRLAARQLGRAAARQRRRKPSRDATLDHPSTAASSYDGGSGHYGGHYDGSSHYGGGHYDGSSHYGGGY